MAFQLDVLPRAQKAACVNELWHNREDTNELTFIKEWLSEAHLEAHLLTPHIKNLFVQLKNLEISEPQVMNSKAA